MSPRRDQDPGIESISAAEPTAAASVDGTEVEGVEVLGAEEGDDDPHVLDLPLGRPFAIAGDCEILPEGGPDKLPGTFATVACDCGELFKLNLLVESDKKCPGCGAVFTHALVIGRADDQTLAQEFIDEVLVSNGYEPVIARDEAAEGDEPAGG